MPKAKKSKTRAKRPTPKPPQYKNPTPTVDCIVELPGDRIVLIRRKNPPLGWALPGGFVDEGEPLHAACVREVKEETGLEVDLSEQFFTYSDPARDPAPAHLSTVYIGWAEGEPRGLGRRRRGARPSRSTRCPSRAVLRPRAPSWPTT